MTKRRLARWMRHTAQRLDPAPPLTYETNMVMTDATEALRAMVNGQLGGRIGLGYIKPDGSKGGTQ